MGRLGVTGTILLGQRQTDCQRGMYSGQRPFGRGCHTGENDCSEVRTVWLPTFDQRCSSTQGGFHGQIFSITNFLQEVFSKNTFIMVGVLGGWHNERLVDIVLIDQNLGVECPEMSMLSTGLGTIHL